MILKNEGKEYYDYLIKNKKYILMIYFILEILIFLKIGREYKFMFIGSLFVTIFVICTIILMMKDFKTAMNIYMLSMPILPMVLYLFSRLKIEDVGNFVYLFYFGIFLYVVSKELKKGNFDFSKINFKGKYKVFSILASLLVLLSIVSITISIHQVEATYYVFTGLITMLVYSAVLICYKARSVSFYKDIIFYLIMGVVLSGVPDSIVALYYIISKNANQHLYGPLGSNFILGYTIIILPYLLYNSVCKDRNRSSSYLKLLFIELFVFMTQMSRGILVILIVCFVLLLIVDRKQYKKYLIFGLIMIGCVCFNVSHRWELSNFNEEVSSYGIAHTINNNDLISTLLNQAKNRGPIWEAGISMVENYPYFGVGPGQFKYYYLNFGGDPKKPYLDAHNITLVIATELGIPFAAIFFGTIITVMFSLYFIGIKKKKIILVLGAIGFSNLLIYGNITGQAFMTFVKPVSVVPAFVFTMVFTIMLVLKKEFSEEL